VTFGFFQAKWHYQRGATNFDNCFLSLFAIYDGIPQKYLKNHKIKLFSLKQKSHLFNKTLKILFRAWGAAMFVISFIMSYIVILNFNSSSKLDELYKNQKKLIELHFQYKFISNQISTYSTEYVVSGNLLYETLYKNLLGAYKGEAAWDNGKIIPFVQMLKELDLTVYQAQQIDLLHLKHQNLRNIELEAINSMKGVFNDGFGNFVFTGQPNKNYATELLFSEKYDNVKEVAMQATDAFFRELLKNNDDLKTKMLKANRKREIVIEVCMFFGILLLVLLFFIVRYRVINRIQLLICAIKELSAGNYLAVSFSHNINDEITDLKTELNKFVQQLEIKSQFIKDVSEGKFETDFVPENKNDFLGNSLLLLKQNIKEAQTKIQKQQIENEQKNRIAEGLAFFANILRKNDSDLHKLLEISIAEIVKYVNANQGAIYKIVSEEFETTDIIELHATYAYGNLHNIKKILQLGEGFVGRCIAEKNTIKLTEIPEDYINITSGLGGAKPRNLIFVPFINGNTAIGALEIASFHFFENYDIEFLEKVAHLIASTVVTVNNKENTENLLKNSQHQREELANQEEELRQNFEELKAIQEDSLQKEENLLARIEELENEIKILKKLNKF